MAHLTNPQLQALKAAINAVPAWASLPLNSDSAFFIAAELAKPASPAFIVWKHTVSITEVGRAMNSAEVGSLTTANTNRLQVMAAFSGGTFDPSKTDTRAGFDSVFSGAGGALTRAALLALYKRSANQSEKLFSSGTGSDASPATLGTDAHGGVLFGTLSYQHIEEARAL